MKYSLIVAVSENNVIGKDNDMPWRLSADLKNFKEITMGHALIMGRKTFESIGSVLPGRRSCVLTSQDFISDQADLGFYHSFDEIEQTLPAHDTKEAFIIGGAQIYKEFFDKASTFYRTVVHTEIHDGDAFFPEIDLSDWTKIREEKHFKDEKNEYDYTFEVYVKN